MRPRARAHTHTHTMLATATHAHAMLATAMSQVRFLNMAMAHFGTSQVVPVYYVLFTLASVLGGIIMYREFTSMQAAQITVWGLGFRV